MPDVPERMTPSAGMRSPGRTSTVWPIASDAAGTSRAMPFSSTNAVFGTSSPSARMPARARSAATPSSTSPTANRNTTRAPSSAAPMNRAPAAAIDISISIVNGMPARVAAMARWATGATPTSVAPTNAQKASAGTLSLIIQARASMAPVNRTRRPLLACHQGLPAFSPCACPCFARTPSCWCAVVRGACASWSQPGSPQPCAAFASWRPSSSCSGPEVRDGGNLRVSV